MTVRLILAAGLLVLATSCGEEAPVARDPAPDDPTATVGPLVVVDGEVQVSCDGHAPGWAPSLMRDGIPGVLTDDEAVGAFRAMLDDPELGAELRLSNVFPDDPADTDWRVLIDEGTSIGVGLGPWTELGPGPGINILTLEREDGRWAWAGMGTCQLEPVLVADDVDWVTVNRPESGLDRDSRSPVVGVSERECTSGRDPGPFLLDPYVVEHDETVTVYWTSEAPTGYHTCPGRAPVERALELDAPLGDRELLDGSVWPPVPVGPPPF